nr:hypothetical protein [Paenibacillus sp. SYP-B4298]
MSLTYNELLGRRNEILKRRIGSMILKHNKHGLSGQERSFYRMMLREWHQTEQELHGSRKDS